MSWLTRVRALFRRTSLSADYDEELRYHLAMLEQTNAEAGLSAGDAHLAAKRRFGNAALLKEEMHDADVATFLESVAYDLRFAFRMLAKNPSFTALAVAALAVGIGVNTAVFTAYKSLLLQPLDARDARQLVNIYRANTTDSTQPTFSYPDFEFYRDNNKVFNGLVATVGDELALTGGEGYANPANEYAGTLARSVGFSFPSLMHGGAEFVSAVSVSENYFSVLGTNAMRGRVFLPQDAQELDNHPAILISENYWNRRFASDLRVLGAPIKLNGVSFSIIGITPHDFLGTNINVPDFWLPMRLRPVLYKSPALLHDPEDFCCALYGRLAAGIPISQAQSQMTLLAQQLYRKRPSRTTNSKPPAVIVTPGSHIRLLNPFRDPGLAFAILLSMGAVGLVLLIACANVASLQLSRSAARQREIGVRLSLGANRLRIIRQLLTESMLLGVLAGAASMLTAWGALRILMIEIAASLPLEWGSVALHVEPDSLVFAYVFAISLIAGILFGLAPALEASRQDLFSALKDDGARFGFRLGNAHLRDLLVGTQVAVSLLLLITAGLLIRGSIRASVVNPGYETKKVTWLNINFPPGFGYTHAKQLSELRQLKERFSSLASVRFVSSGNAPDSGGLRNAAVGIDNAAASKSDFARTLYYSFVSANYFPTLGIRTLRGHSSWQNADKPEPVAVLSESAAEMLWPGKDPVGRTLTLDATKQFHGHGELIPAGTRYEVIAVVNDTRGIIPGGDDAKKVYLPLPTDRADDLPLLVRSDLDSKQLIPELAKQVQAVDSNLVVYAETLEGLMTSTPTFVISRASAIFVSIIGVLGLCLACVGIYGTVSYAVVRRTRELGIRMALGAHKADVLRLVLHESSSPVLYGIFAGILMALAASHVLRALLFGMSTLDPTSFLGVAALFLFIALLAAYVPARQAMMVDPMVALRCE